MIQVGHDYQATVPEGLSLYGDAPGMYKKALTYFKITSQLFYK